MTLAKKYALGERISARWTAPAGEQKHHSGWYEAIFRGYVGEDECKVSWPHWGTGFSPEVIVDIEDVRPLR